MIAVQYVSTAEAIAFAVVLVAVMILFLVLLTGGKK